MESVSHTIGDPLMKAIMTYWFHPSIITVKENRNSDLSFNFCRVERDEVMKEINKLIPIKPLNTGIPTTLIKEDSDIFGDFTFGNYNNCVSYSIFPNSLKNAIITPVKKIKIRLKIIIHL